MPHSGQDSAQRHRRQTIVVLAGGVLAAFIIETLRGQADVVTASDAPNALHVVAISGPSPVAAVLVSSSVPRAPSRPLGCMPFVRKMFDEWPWIPIVVLCSTRQTERLRAESLSSGVRRFLRTPFTGAELRTAIGGILDSPGPARPGTGMIRAVKRIRAYLADHFAEAPRLGDLAEMAGMSPTHLSRAFHAVVGVSLRRHALDLRLRLATDLLLTTRLAITDVAHESGFYDLPHLDKAFRQRLGTSPLGFRCRHAARVRDA